MYTTVYAYVYVYIYIIITLRCLHANNCSKQESGGFTFVAHTARHLARIPNCLHDMCVLVYTHIHSMYIYICMYRERERETYIQ